MFRDLFINITILITFIFLGGQFFKKNQLSLSSSFKSRFLSGIGGGLLGIALMLYSINISEANTIVDLRYIAIVMITYLSGGVPSIITTLIIIAFRIFYFGIKSSHEIIILSILAITLCSNIIVNMKIDKRKKWVLMNISSVTSVIIALCILLKDNSELGVIISQYMIASVLGATIAYHLINYIHDSNMLIEKLKIESKQDFLTGLKNVRQFDSKMNELIEESKRNKRELSMLILDIDHFKKINDNFGHPAGDAILKQLAFVMRGSCIFNDEIFRIGGEEFSIILPDRSIDQAMIIAERIRKTVEKYDFVLPDNTVINITISIGVATYPNTVTDINDLIKHADDGLYKAKHAGRNMVCYIKKN